MESVRLNRGSVPLQNPGVHQQMATDQEFLTSKNIADTIISAFDSLSFQCMGSNTFCKTELGLHLKKSFDDMRANGETVKLFMTHNDIYSHPMTIVLMDKSTPESPFYSINFFDHNFHPCTSKKPVYGFHCVDVNLVKNVVLPVDKRPGHAYFYPNGYSLASR